MILIDEDSNSSQMSQIYIGKINQTDRLIIERYIIGSSTFIFSFTTFLLYVLCLKIVAKLKCQSSFYKLAFHIGLSDVGQLFFNGVVSSAFLIFCAGQMENREILLFVRRLIGALMGVFWFSNGFLVHCLAFNRFLNVYFLIAGRKIFDERNTKIAIVLAWLQGSVWFVLYMRPDSLFVYNMNFYTYTYGSSSASYLNSNINFWVNIFHMTGLLLWHFLILLKICRTPQMLQEMQRNSSQARRRRQRRRRALLQCLVLCSLYLATIVTFHIVQWAPVHRFWSLTANTVWMLCCGANVLVYVTLNRSVGAALLMTLFVFDGSVIKNANAAVAAMLNRKTSPSTYEEDCYQLNKWADFLRTKIDPSLLDYALYQCKLVTDEQATRSSGTFYDDFDYGHNLFVRSENSNMNKNQKKGLGEVIRFGKRGNTGTPLHNETIVQAELAIVQLLKDPQETMVREKLVALKKVLKQGKNMDKFAALAILQSLKSLEKLCHMQHLIFQSSNFYSASVILKRNLLFRVARKEKTDVADFLGEIVERVIRDKK